MDPLEFLEYQSVLGIVTEYILHVSLLKILDNSDTHLQLLLILLGQLLCGHLEQVEVLDKVVPDEEKETVEDSLHLGHLQSRAVSSLQEVEEEGLEVVGVQGRAD